MKLGNIVRILAFLPIITLVTACSISEMTDMFKKANDINAVLQNNCDCDEVSMVEYSMNNFVTTASYKLVGCEFESLDDESLRVMKILTDSIPQFCDIDYFNLVFVNKGEREVKSYADCRER